MKERVTFVQTAGKDFSPERLRLQGGSLHVKALKAAQEDRLTFGLYELPQEVQLTQRHNPRFFTDDHSYGKS